MTGHTDDKAVVEPDLVTQTTAIDAETGTHLTSVSKEAFVHDVVHIRTSLQEEKRVLRKIDW